MITFKKWLAEVTSNLNKYDFKNPKDAIVGTDAVRDSHDQNWNIIVYMAKFLKQINHFVQEARNYRSPVFGDRMNRIANIMMDINGELNLTDNPSGMRQYATGQKNSSDVFQFLSRTRQLLMKVNSICEQIIDEYETGERGDELTNMSRRPDKFTNPDAPSFNYNDKETFRMAKGIFNLIKKSDFFNFSREMMEPRRSGFPEFEH